MENFTIKNVTEEVKSSVSAYLMARAYAETMRSAVDEIQRTILEECPLHDRRDDVLITDPKDAWHCDNEHELKDYWAECDARLRAAGLKPANMPDTHCPALVAEHVQMQTTWLIAEAAAKMLKLDFDGKELNCRLLCMGLDKRREFIDTIVGLVVNLPDFKSPPAKEQFFLAD